MKRPRPACSWRLAAASPVAVAVGLTVVAAVASSACRAPSGGAEHEPVAASKASPQVPPDAAGEPTPRADERSPGGVAPTEPAIVPEPAVVPVVPTEPGAAPTAPVEAAPDAPSEPAVAPAEPTPAAAPTEPARKPCRRPGPRAKGPLRELVGLDETAVRRCLGAPDRTSGSTWHYQWPKGCAYEVTRVVVRFARGTVTRANADHEITGKHCGSEL